MRSIAWALGALLLTTAVARAQQAKPWAEGVSEEQQRRALVLYEQGNAEFEESRYPQALVRYEEAITHWDHPAIRFNMAVCLINLTRPLDAYRSLESALRHGEEPIGASAYQQGLNYRKLLEGQLGTLTVKCDAPGAEVTLDGRKLFTAPGEVTELMLAGEHQLVASKQGFLTET